MTAHAELRALAEATPPGRTIQVSRTDLIALLDQLDAATKANSELVDRVRLADADVILQDTGSGRGRVA